VMMWRQFVSGVAGLAVCLALVPPAYTAEKAVLRNGFEIRHAQREEIGPTTRLYLSADGNAGYIDVNTSEIESFEHDDLPVFPTQPAALGEKPAATTSAAEAGRIPVDVPALVNRASDQHLVDADLIASVIKAESGFNHRAVSPKGAQGLMQLMPGTAGKLGVKDAFDPAANVDGGTRYLRELLLRYNNDIPKALAAYNAGPERVDQCHGVPPYRETHAYVVKVIKDFNRKKRAAGQTASSSSHKSSRTKKVVSAAAPAANSDSASKM
jgi:soluble lytic murein transglycosylase-like protein